MIFSLVACGPAQPSAAVTLYQRLAPAYAQLTRESRRVSIDLAALRGPVRTARTEMVRRLGGRLRRDADLLQLRATHICRALRPLSHQLAPALRTYAGLSARVACLERSEAGQLGYLAKVLQADPLLLDAGDLVVFHRSQKAADWFAWQAVVAGRQAALVRHRHVGAFRYQVS